MPCTGRIVEIGGDITPVTLSPRFSGDDLADGLHEVDGQTLVLHEKVHDIPLAPVIACSTERQLPCYTRDEWWR